MKNHTTTAIWRAILLDLRAGQSTPDNISGRLRIDPATIERHLDLMESDSLVETFKIADTIKVFRITSRGLETIS